MSRCYVAGSSRELPRVRAAMTALRMSGIEVTLDWTEGAEGWPALVEMSESARLDAARADLSAIDRADVVLVLASPHRSECMVEMGYAMGQLIDVVIAGPLADRGIFGACANDEFDTDAEAIAAVLARGRR